MYKLGKNRQMIDESVRKIILDRIDEIEATHGIQILLAIESGSRAWGFPSPDSDYDVRFIYKSPLNHYLAISDKKDTLDFKITDELDLAGWDLKKALYLMFKSNVPLFEWLDSPVVYKEDEKFRAEMNRLCSDYFRVGPGMHHYLSMAKHFIDDERFKSSEIPLKKFFYMFRALICTKWIWERKSQPMTAMPLMMGKGILSEWVEMEVKDLIDTKSMMVESGTTHISKNIREWCEATFYELSGNFDELQHLPMPDIEKLDECFFTLCTYKVW
jgi:predicted nucleotidyltransferase